jgi:gliding motility-associated-like protein
VESLPSNESCAELKIDLPVIKNVDVTQTSLTSGSIFIAWYRPVASPDHLDTTQLTGPYEYRLYRSPGFDLATPIQIAAFSNQFFGNLKDTTFVDTQLNTVDGPYSYQVKLFANGIELGGSDIASSVYLTIAAKDNALDLRREEKVPWVNFEYIIFRKAPGATSFDTLAIVQTDSFSDIGLTNGLEYCYYITSLGEYTSEALEDTLVNNSQQVCAIPVDTVPPCPPDLTVENNCRFEADGDPCELGPTAFQNNLSWVNPGDEGCEPVKEILKYHIYFSEPGKYYFVKIAETDTLFYTYISDTSLAGCFAVTAIDSFGNESEFSDTVCTDNCPCYQLPNVFTPNNDGHNEHFKPIHPYRFIGKVDMKIFNRWGTLVHETEDPDIMWDGTDINNGKPVKEGVYYYVCTVYEIRVEGLRKNSNVLSGFIHLIRGNGATN